MRNLLNPKWIFIINTLPILILFFIFYGEFQIIKSLLEDDSIQLWKNFGLALAILGISNAVYGLFLTLKGKNISIYYGVIALVFYTVFIYLYNVHSDKIIPFSIPRWMIPGNMIVYIGTFLMPTLAYALFSLVVHFTPESKEHNALKSFLMAIGIPVAWYAFSQVLLPLWKLVEGNFNTHTFLVFIITGTIVFLFFLIRGLYILATKKEKTWQKYQLAWKIPISIVLPIVGLLLNNGHLFNNFDINESGIFGDFSSYWFYILAFLNGLLLCLPNLENKTYRIILFISRSVSFAYTFYFFIVFLPFLPLSVIAVVIIGTGFLMLAPLLLFVIHINELSKDFKYLNTQFSINALWTFSLISFLVIPICLTLNYLNDKKTLNQTLEYLYSPDYSKHYDIDSSSLKKTLRIVKGHKDTNRGGIFGSQQPYLSTYFNWLVLDNLTLSDTKINKIEKIFFGTESFELSTENIRNFKVELTNISSISTYDNSQNVWKSWIDLEITNKSNNSWPSEYLTTIDLPEGSWISDYYLFIGNKKEMGILAEKKTAMWVFSNIRNENRDPGILYYLTGNKVAFRVFPFSKNEIRKTGIELLHKEPIQITIDGKTLKLGHPNQPIVPNIENKNVVYVSASEKETLKKIIRKPYFHFVVEATNEDQIPYFTKRMEELTKKQKGLAENTKISFVNRYVTTVPFDSSWQKQFQSQDFQGGFYIDRAIKSILFNAYKKQGNTYPVIVVVTDSLANGIFDNDFSDWSFSFPESNLFYTLNEEGILESHSLLTNPLEKVSGNVDLTLNQPVLKYTLNDSTTKYLPNNNQPSIILKKDLFDCTETDIKEKNWNTALTLQAKWTSQILHPETSNQEWLNLVKYSFLSKVMTPVTSYLVVENEAQKAILKKKQAQVLSSNKSLDLGEDTQRMTEPSLILLIISLGIFYLWRRKKSKDSRVFFIKMKNH